MASNYSKARHDIGVTLDNGDTVGLMLVRDKNGVPDYKEIIDEYLADQQFTSPDYQAMPAERELLFVQDDWRSGFGEYIYDNTDPKRYFASYGFDLRFKNMGILSNKARAITLPTTTNPTLNDGGMEIWTDANNLTYWTKDGTGTLRQSTTRYTGNYSARLTGAQIYQDLSTTEIAGRRFKATARIYSTAAGYGRIGIYDGVDTAWSGNVVVANTWELHTVYKTLSTSATRLRVICDNPNASCNVYFDEVTIERVDRGYITSHLTYNNNEYFGFSGGLLAKLNSTGDGLTPIYEFPTGITSLEFLGDGFAYIGTQSEITIDNCDEAWTAGSGYFTVTADTGDKKEGTASNKIVVASGAAARDIAAYKNLASPMNLSYYAGISLWIKCSVATSLGDLRIRLSKKANLGHNTSEIDIPALTANKWTKVYARQSAASSAQYIASIGLIYYTDIGECTIWIDDIRAEDSYYYMDTGENPIASTLSTTDYSFAQYFANVSDTMWKSLPPNNIYSSVDPTNTGSWSGATLVGGMDYDITALVSSGETLYIMKGDMPYYVDSAGAVKMLTKRTLPIASSTGGKNTYIWDDALYMPYGQASLLERDETGNYAWRDPALYCTNLGDFDGTIQAVTGDEQFLFIVVDNGTKLEVIAGREENIDGVARWVWHPQQEITLTGCSVAWVSSIYQKRLYIASTSASEDLYYVPLFVNYGDVTNDTNADFQSGGYFITPYLPMGFPNINKSFVKLTLRMENTDANAYFKAYYKKLGDSDWTLIGNFTTSPSTSQFIPVDASLNKPTTTMMSFKIEGITNDTQTTPKLVAMEIEGVGWFKMRTLIALTINASNEVKDKEGVPLRQTADSIKSIIDEFKNATWPKIIYDLDGTARAVRLLPGSLYKPSAYEHKRPIDREFSLLLQEVKLS